MKRAICSRIEEMPARVQCYIEGGAGQGNAPVFGAFWSAGSKHAEIVGAKAFIEHDELKEWAWAYLALRDEESKR